MIRLIDPLIACADQQEFVKDSSWERASFPGGSDGTDTLHRDGRAASLTELDRKLDSVASANCSAINRPVYFVVCKVY